MSITGENLLKCRTVHTLTPYRHRAQADVLLQIVLNPVSSFPSWFSAGSEASNSSHRAHLQPPETTDNCICSGNCRSPSGSAPQWADTHRLRLTAQRNPNCILLEKGIIKPTCGWEGKCLIPPPQNMEDNCDLHATLPRHSRNHGRMQHLWDHPCECHIQGELPLPKSTNSATHH